MPGAVVTFANTAMCAHGGNGTPGPPTGFVVIAGMGAFNLSHQYNIVGCTFPAMTLGAQPPCVLGKIFRGTTRVFTKGGLPLAILPDSISSSAGMPNPMPLNVMPVPGVPRVIAK
jgi:hypothetical protein